jgi:hypothetical protein
MALLVVFRELELRPQTECCQPPAQRQTNKQAGAAVDGPLNEFAPDERMNENCPG